LVFEEKNQAEHGLDAIQMLLLQIIQLRRKSRSITDSW
jgi:hypothetical protein